MKVLCFGSLNVDMVFTVQNFVKPKETIHSQSLTYFAGGKGLNQAIALRKAEADVYLAGSIGQDGQILLETCRKNDLNARYVRTTEGSSGMAVIQVDQEGENCIILYEGANGMNSTTFMDDVLKDFHKGDLIVLQNEINNLPYLIEAASRKEMKIVLNPSPVHESLLQCGLEKCSYLVLNEVEGKMLSGKEDYQEIVRTLYGTYKNQIILTVGKDGVYFNEADVVHHVSAITVKAVDTTGAGDAFTGYVIGEISRGKNVKEAIETAVFAAGIAVTKTGASESIPPLAEVEAKMKNVSSL